MSFALRHFTNKTTGRSLGVFPEKPAPVNTVISIFEVMKDMGRRAYEIHITWRYVCPHTDTNTERGERVKGSATRRFCYHRNLRKSIRDLSHTSTVATITLISHCGHGEGCLSSATIDPPLRRRMRSIPIPSQVQAPSSTTGLSMEGGGDPSTQVQEAQEGRWKLKPHRCPPQCQSPRLLSDLHTPFCYRLLLFN